MSLLFPATMNSLFDSFFDDNVYRPASFSTSTGRGKNFPNVNIYKDDSGYRMEFAVPGYSRDDFQISVDNSVLTIKVEAEDTEVEKNATAYREYRYTSFTRNFNIGNDINVDGITSRYTAGILTLELPYREEKLPKTRQITVE